jgi:hypothetical protein
MKEKTINKCTVKTNEFLTSDSIEKVLFHCIDARNTYKDEVFYIVSTSQNFYGVKDKFDNFIGGSMLKKDLENQVFLEVINDK